MPLWSGLDVAGISASLSQAMVDDMVHQSCSYIIRHKGMCMASSTSSSSSPPPLPPPPPPALPPSMLAKFLKCINWGLFVAGWLVFSFASKCLQVCIWVVAITWCVLYFGYTCFPNDTPRFHFWAKCLVYETKYNMQDQMCCIKE